MFEGVYPHGNFSWHHLWFIAYLFVVSLLISPFLNFTRTASFASFREKLLAVVSRPLGMNWVLVVIIGSQWYLRKFWPESTHALFNDWAYFTYYLLFFLIGYVFFTSDQVIKAVKDQRQLYGVQTLVGTILLFSMRGGIINLPDSIRMYAFGITQMTLSLSCGLAAIGYFKMYFNKDHKLRSVLNEAIYPFYLLHQPVIIVVGYFILDWTDNTLIQAVAITLTSLLIIAGVYWFVIKRFNVLRFAFGMKTITQPKAVKAEKVLQPVYVQAEISKC